MDDRWADGHGEGGAGLLSFSTPLRAYTWLGDAAGGAGRQAEVRFPPRKSHEKVRKRGKDMERTVAKEEGEGQEFFFLSSEPRSGDSFT